MLCEKFQLDELGCLQDFNSWSPEFVFELAPSVGIEDITQDHFDILFCIRKYVSQNKKNPIIFEICRKQRIKLRDMERLFPYGFYKSACLLAGLNYFGQYS